MSEDPVSRARAYVLTLCAMAPDRHVGSDGNNAAVDFFESVVANAGWEVESTPFDCLDWEDEGSAIELPGGSATLHTGPYSLPCDVRAPVALASSVERIEAGGLEGKVLVLHGDIASEQLFPKNFEFYNPPQHKRVYAALEAAAPAAVLAVTTRNPSVTGSVYPFPLIEDGDFDIPNAYLADEEAGALLEAEGAEAHLRIGSRRIPSRGRQLLARKRGTGEGRVVVFGHIDGRKGIPAALDNASGASSLLVLAGLLAGYGGPLTVEIVPINGEDYYGACGEVIWMRENREKLGDIVLGMNADDSGHVGAGTGVSLYGCPDETAALVRGLIARYPGFLEGPQWPQSDHSLFTFNGVPAIAFTAEDFMDTFREITHTPRDRPELVDPAIVADVARFMADVIEGLGAETRSHPGT